MIRKVIIKEISYSSLEALITSGISSLDIRGVNLLMDSIFLSEQYIAKIFSTNFSNL